MTRATEDTSLPPPTLSHLVESSLALIKSQGWADFSLEDLAQETGYPLSHILSFFPTKHDLFLAVFNHIEEAYEIQISSLPSFEQDTPKDKLFDLFMTRFEVLAPYKEVFLRAGSAALKEDPFLILLHEKKSHHFLSLILEGAGFPKTSLTHFLQVKSLYVLYLWAFKTWLLDPDPALNQTMATLDKGLTQLQDWRIL
jgi:AcrR family transcriptional regulator